jgi:hypothetical protein
MLITLIDPLFVLGGLAVIGSALRRRWAAPPPASPPPASLGEVVLTGLALVPAAVGPNILVVALTPGMPGMPTLTRWVLLPSVLLLLVVWGAARMAGYERLTNRIWTGLWAGAVATAALDVFRLTSFTLGLLPGNLPRMFGVLILNTMATGPTPLSDFVGYVYHYWISASFGLAYALLVGQTRWWGGLIWGLIIEVGMMTTPPMVVAMGTGYFGLKLGHGILNGVFIGSLIPHIAYGTVLGLLLERYLGHQGTLFDLVREAWRSLRYGPTTTRAQISPERPGP